MQGLAGGTKGKEEGREGGRIERERWRQGGRNEGGMEGEGKEG